MRSLSIAVTINLVFVLLAEATNKYNQLLMSNNLIQQNSNNAIKSKRSSSTENNNSKCETIYTSYCQNIGYNQTNMLLSPFSFMNQDEAGLELSQFYELLTSGCKRRTKDTMTLLMCSLYTPTCIEVSTKTKQKEK